MATKYEPRLQFRNPIWLLSLAFCLVDNPSFARGPSDSHKSMTAQIANSIEWAKHLNTEAGKGKKMSLEHVQEEVQAMHGAFKLMGAAYVQLAKESPRDVQEGHFISLRKHQERAAELLNQFESESAKSKVNHSVLKKLSKEIGLELKGAEHEHALELHEIELQQ